MNWLPFAEFPSIRAGMQARMHDISALLVMVLRQQRRAFLRR
ncbi:MAG: hypothetical protein NTV57_12090 [Cyanobacteria bacterium]|nr:hypothetical protein [Cyanobacteriota bacterium]